MDGATRGINMQSVAFTTQQILSNCRILSQILQEQRRVKSTIAYPVGQGPGKKWRTCPAR